MRFAIKQGQRIAGVCRNRVDSNSPSYILRQPPRPALPSRAPGRDGNDFGKTQDRSARTRAATRQPPSIDPCAATEIPRSCGGHGEGCACFRFKSAARSSALCACSMRPCMSNVRPRLFQARAEFDQAQRPWSIYRPLPDTDADRNRGCQASTAKSISRDACGRALPESLRPVSHCLISAIASVKLSSSARGVTAAALSKLVAEPFMSPAEKPPPLK